MCILIYNQAAVNRFVYESDITQPIIIIITIVVYIIICNSSDYLFY